MPRSRVAQQLRRFRGAETGGIALIFGLLFVVLLMAAGGAVDFLRAYHVKSDLQAALDGAALAAGATSLPDSLDVASSEPILQKVVDDYMQFSDTAISKFAVLEPTSLTYTPEPATRRHLMTLKSRAVMETVFLSIVGIDTLTIGATSYVRRAAPGPLEVALVLDTTTSMSRAVSTADSTRRIDALKLAAETLADLVLETPNPLAPAKVGVVPFAGMFNLGTTDHAGNRYRDSTPVWLDIAPNSTTERCCKEPPPAKKCFTDGVPTKCPLECVDDPAASFNRAGYACRTFDKVWLGCVGPRPVPHRDDLDNYSAVKYPTNLQSCGSSRLLDLTTSHTDVVTSIKGLAPTSGEGFIPAGLIWGWNMLINENDSNPLRQAVSESDAKSQNLRKILILMTDGGNTLVPVSRSWFFQTSTDVKVSNDLTAEVCNNIEEDGIVVYTVLLGEHSEGVKSLIEDCASADGRFYTAETADDLVDAFENIFDSLSRMTIVSEPD